MRASGLTVAENPALERSGGGGGDRRQSGLAPSGQLGGLAVAGPRRAALTGRSAAGGLGLGPWNARGTQAWGLGRSSRRHCAERGLWSRALFHRRSPLRGLVPVFLIFVPTGETAIHV